MPLYMSPNFAHTIGRITGYLRFVPKVLGKLLLRIAGTCEDPQILVDRCLQRIYTNSPTCFSIEKGGREVNVMDKIKNFYNGTMTNSKIGGRR